MSDGQFALGYSISKELRDEDSISYALLKQSIRAEQQRTMAELQNSFNQEVYRGNNSWCTGLGNLSSLGGYSQGAASSQMALPYYQKQMPITTEEAYRMIRDQMGEYGVKVPNKLIKGDCPMAINGKKYIAWKADGSLVGSDENLDTLKKLAADAAHSSQGSVYIFQPVLEIAPKRDVVESSITLGK